MRPPQLSGRDVRPAVRPGSGRQPFRRAGRGQAGTFAADIAEDDGEMDDDDDSCRDDADLAEREADEEFDGDEPSEGFEDLEGMDAVALLEVYFQGLGARKIFLKGAGKGAKGGGRGAAGRRDRGKAGAKSARSSGTGPATAIASW